MEVGEVLFNFVRGRHTFGQMFNLTRYAAGSKKLVANYDPIYISVFPTLRCNLNCDMCITHSGKFDNPFGQKPARDMDFALFKQILDKYKNALAVNLIGNGEPLLNKDLFKMIEYAANIRKMYTYSGSNGIIVGEYAEKIIRSRLTGFNISINGHNGSEFNRMTGMPAKCFDTARDNIIKLVELRNRNKSGIQITASIILDKANYRELGDMVQFGKTLGVDRILFHPFLASPVTGFTAEERSLFSDDRDVVETFDQARLLAKKAGVKITLPPLLRRSMDGKFCSVPFYNITFDGAGQAGGCCCQILNLSGNKRFDEEDVWNNAQFREFRRRFLDPEFPILEPCQWCYNNQGRSRMVSSPNLIYSFFRRLTRGHER